MSPSFQDQIQLALGETYSLERELGGGGMSRVFVAHERALGRKVVIKVLLPELAAGVNVERFRREIQLAAQLQHPHIVPLLSAGEADGLPYFIMPFVSGESLRARITREGEFPIGDTVHILRSVSSALAYAHGFGVIHRDVKPDNVLLSHGVAVVTDFGVAKAISASSGDPQVAGLTSIGVALGTPAYMAPEQASASPLIDHRADIYALGAMAYELLTGSPPFAGRTAQATLAAHVIEEPEPVERRRPATPPLLANLVRDCLCKRPADRPQSATQIMNLLDAMVTPSGGTAATTAVRTPAILPPKTRARWAVPAVVGAVILLAAGVLWVQRTRSGNEERPSTPPPPVTPQDTSASRAGLTPPETLETQRRPSQPVIVAVPAAPPTIAPARPKPRRAAPAPTPVSKRPSDTAARDTAAALDSQPAETISPPSAAAPLPAPAPPPPVSPPPRPEPPPSPVVAPPAAVDQRPAIRNVVAEYAAAIEARNLEAIRRAYPAMTDAQENGWRQFFQITRDIKAELALPQIQISGSAAEGVVSGSYTYLNTTNGKMTTQPVTFRARFEMVGGRWRLVAVK